jgi:hypothetical protein
MLGASVSMEGIMPAVNFTTRKVCIYISSHLTKSREASLKE